MYEAMFEKMKRRYGEAYEDLVTEPEEVEYNIDLAEEMRDDIATGIDYLKYGGMLTEDEAERLKLHNGSLCDMLTDALWDAAEEAGVA